MTRSNQDLMNEANPNKVASAIQVLKGGDAYGLIPRFVKGTVGTVTTHVLTLPNNAKACAVLAAYSTVGTLTGRLTPVQQGTAVTTGLVGITAGGDILFATADAVTAAEVQYISYEGNVITETVAVSAAGVASLGGGRSAVLLIAANLLTGTTTGVKTINARGGSAPATTTADVSDTGGVRFAAADATPGGTATITYVATPGIGSEALPLSGRLALDATT